MAIRKGSLEGMEREMIDRKFWNNRKVFITGHTGFKGSWLSLWLYDLGAKVTGYALQPPTKPSLFELCRIDGMVKSIIADVRDLKALSCAMSGAGPEIVIHMAAQPLVLESYEDPVETYSTNVMGTVNLFEAVRRCKGIKAVINVTSDKCYENRERVRGYRENEPMGGFDPYSNSKGCSELVTSAYRNSFFSPAGSDAHAAGLASARSGNVMGGGDWAKDRLIPDCVRALLKGEKIMIRNPAAIRPWQHVLEPLSGYLVLAQRLYGSGPEFSQAWNFGPESRDEKSVEWIVKRICDNWGGGASYETSAGDHPHEATCLKLDHSKAKTRLGWRPRWKLEHSIGKVVEWTKAYGRKEDLTGVSLKQIEEYSQG